MPSGFAPVFVITPTQEDIAKLNMVTYNTFLNELEKQQIELDTYGQYKLEQVDKEEFEDGDVELVDAAYEAFQKEFHDEYKINIHVNHHNKSDDGDIYDGVEGAYFALEYLDVYELTDNAKKLKEVLPFDFAQFVVYG